MKFLALITLFVGSSLSPLHASWGPTAQGLLQQSAPHATFLQDPVVATFWGGFKRYASFTHNRGEIIPLPTKLFRAQSVPIYVSLQEHRAPLTVFMPGIFGRAGRGVSKAMIDHLEALGNHVLVVPNLLSPTSISAYPLYGEDPLVLEVELMETALDFMQQRLGDRLGPVHVIAESLGTLVGVAWVAGDRQKLKRIAGLTLLWPPLELKRAMINFDRVINQYRQADASCSLFTTVQTVYQHFLWQDFPGRLEKKQAECLGAVVMFDGFMSSTQRSWEAYTETVPSLKAEPPKSFETFFQQYRPQWWNYLKNDSPQIRLSYWMKILAQDPTFPVHLMSSRDDFLNRDVSWENFLRDAHHPNLHTLILPWGGHSGPIALPQFRDILKTPLTR